MSIYLEGAYILCGCLLLRFYGNFFHLFCLPGDFITLITKETKELATPLPPIPFSAEQLYQLMASEPMLQSCRIDLRKEVF